MVAADLFAGAGGSSTGAEMAGVHVIAALNHWPVAVEAHRRNHPQAAHYCQDAMQFDWRQMPRVNVLMASPECRGHAKAHGKERPHHDSSRSTAWAPIQCLDTMRQGKRAPALVIIENVPEFRRWNLYPAWRFAFECLGYRLNEYVLNAGDFGVPIRRERLIIVAVHGRRALDLEGWPSTDPVPARDVIDWDDGPWRPVHERAKSLTAPTLGQIRHGLNTWGDRFHIRYNGSARQAGAEYSENPHRPLGSLTTVDRFGVVRLIDGRPHLRFLTTAEQARAMGFPAGYWFPRGKHDVSKLIGNAVSPPLMMGVLERALRRL